MSLDTKQTNSGSIIDPTYSNGNYFSDAQRFSSDAQFKAANFVDLFLRFKTNYSSIPCNSFVDVGCGSGDVIKLIADALRANGMNTTRFSAYDVSPHVLNVKNEGINYHMGDFCQSDENVDIVTAFDVFEHVPDTIGFLKSIAQRCKVVGLHIPLDNSLNSSMRNRYHAYLQNPGHLINLDLGSALNLLAFSGLRVVDYKYTFGFLAPSGHSSLPSKILYPLRYLFAKLNPWILSKTLGGASLMVVALTANGLREVNS